MSAVPIFFVPNVTDGKDEEVLAELARLAQVPTPAVGSRIYSIQFVHDGETWTATVGSSLEGLKNERVAGGRVLSDYERRVVDSATVLAIFSSSPAVVVTDASPVGSARSKWSNPFFAGRIKKTVAFSK